MFFQSPKGCTVRDLTFEPATAEEAGESWNANVVVNRHSEPEETASTSFTLNNNSNLGMFGLINFDGKCD